MTIQIGDRVRILTGIIGAGRDGTVTGIVGDVHTVEFTGPKIITEPDGPQETKRLPYAAAELSKLGFSTLAGMDDVYSSENIARTRRRAAQMRQQIEAGALSPAEDWLEVVANMEADADERERTGRPDPSSF